MNVYEKIAKLKEKDFKRITGVTIVVYGKMLVVLREKYILDLHNREIIGYSSGAHKDAELVRTAFAKVKVNLSGIQMFHTDRGSEFDNDLIDDLLDTFHINRSLSLKGCPFDNAVVESTFKIIKAEFIYRRTFLSSEQLALELADYVHWFNNIRIHSSLGYLSPIDFRQHTSSFLYN